MYNLDKQQVIHAVPWDKLELRQVLKFPGLISEMTEDYKTMRTEINICLAT